MTKHFRNARDFLFSIAWRAMVSRGFEPDFDSEALRQLDGIHEAAERGPVPGAKVRDLTDAPWCSIDNDDSRDLDQLTMAERLGDGSLKLWVAVADVDALVTAGTPLDRRARVNTTTVYTGVTTFAMLPEKLSTDLTSLSQDEPRLAIVVEMRIDAEGRVVQSDVYRARVINRAKLTYHGVAAWLEGQGQLPEPARGVPALDQQLRMQDEAAQRMRKLRHEHGALELETIEPRAILQEGSIVDLRHEPKNRAHELIEDFMIAANGVTARFLSQRGYPTLRRVVRSPEKWKRIAEIAAQYGETLPSEPDPRALGGFLSRQRGADPVRFPDLSLTIVKLMGRGVYEVGMPGRVPEGHFGLAVRDYNHSTAPNRRYPDLVTQRLLKSAIAGQPCPYSEDELSLLAVHCTEKENAADRVERQVRKSAAAMLLSSRIGEHFDGIVTGASEKGTWVRVLAPPVEGRVIHGSHGLEVGDRVQVRLLSVNVEAGWIDFARTGHSASGHGTQ